MPKLTPHQHLLDDPSHQFTAVSRSTFLAWFGLGFGALAGTASAFVSELFSFVPALASFRQAASIGSSMPVVSKIGLFLGNGKTLLPNQTLSYTDPRSGDPAILIRLANGHLVSYDMVCPHQGCSVPYDSTRRLLVCPCHGAQFDPARGAAPLSGPVSQPLITLPIRVDTAGNVYALDARPGTKVNRLHAAPVTSAQSGGDDGVGDDSVAGRHRPRRHGDD
jgi:thiosulfate dehydrogenase (quinone) large subunit